MQLIRGCAGLVPALLLGGSSLLFAQSDAGHRIGEPRARDIGIPFDGTPGPLNAITDVAGVEVGYKTLISGEGKLVVGKGPVRTGVTAILPRGKSGKAGVFAQPTAYYDKIGKSSLDDDRIVFSELVPILACRNISGAGLLSA
jgi:Peptidase family S58